MPRLLDADVPGAVPHGGSAGGCQDFFAGHTAVPVISPAYSLADRMFIHRRACGDCPLLPSRASESKLLP